MIEQQQAPPQKYPILYFNVNLIGARLAMVNMKIT